MRAKAKALIKSIKKTLFSFLFIFHFFNFYTVNCYNIISAQNKLQ